MGEDPWADEQPNENIQEVEVEPVNQQMHQSPELVVKSSKKVEIEVSKINNGAE